MSCTKTIPYILEISRRITMVVERSCLVFSQLHGAVNNTVISIYL